MFNKMDMSGNICVDTYGLGVTFDAPNDTDCNKFGLIKGLKLNIIKLEFRFQIKNAK